MCVPRETLKQSSYSSKRCIHNCSGSHVKADEIPSRGKDDDTRGLEWLTASSSMMINLIRNPETFVQCWRSKEVPILPEEQQELAKLL